MIPKKIHYCWFGKKDIPEDISIRIKKWEEILKDYEFILWNENNFNINKCSYTKEAYDCGKFAYVTDYVRLYALKEHGGIYMDTDVDVLRPLDDFLHTRAFTGMESKEVCVTGTMGAEKNHPWIRSLLEYYNNLNFIKDNKMQLIPNTVSITNITMNEYGWKQINSLQCLKDDLYIYPFDYLCAKKWDTGKVLVTENTYTVHNFSGSWLPPHKRKLKKVKGYIKSIISKVLGEKKFTKIINKKRGISNE